MISFESLVDSLQSGPTRLHPRNIRITLWNQHCANAFTHQLWHDMVWTAVTDRLGSRITGAMLLQLETTGER